MFRPAGIQPLHGVRSKTGWVNAIYVVAAPLLSYLARTAPKYMTTSEQLGRAMIKVARDGYPKPILESEDINAISASVISLPSFRGATQSRALTCNCTSENPSGHSGGGEMDSPMCTPMCNCTSQLAASRRPGMTAVARPHQIAANVTASAVEAQAP